MLLNFLQIEDNLQVSTNEQALNYKRLYRPQKESVCENPQSSVASDIFREGKLHYVPLIDHRTSNQRTKRYGKVYKSDDVSSNQEHQDLLPAKRSDK